MSQPREGLGTEWVEARMPTQHPGHTGRPSTAEGTPRLGRDRHGHMSQNRRQRPRWASWDAGGWWFTRVSPGASMGRPGQARGPRGAHTPPCARKTRRLVPTVTLARLPSTRTGQACSLHVRPEPPLPLRCPPSPPRTNVPIGQTVSTQKSRPPKTPSEM